MRVNKYLAACGLGSRRKCEEIVLSGRVCVNGQKINTLSFDVPDTAEVLVDGDKV